jgi:predicted dehydrogenase
MIKVGIAGSGFMAATHIKAYQQLSGVKVAALCNPSGRNFDGDFSKVAGNIALGPPARLDMREVKTFRSFSDMIQDPLIDFVDICAPTRAHPELAIGALQAGKHVLCEKPVARTSQLARDIAREAERSNRLFMPAMCLRFWPEWTWLKRAIEGGNYGRPLAARFRRVAEPPAWGQQNFFDGAQSGGALLDLHIHDTDFVQFCFGRPQSVFSTGYVKFSGAVDHVVTQYLVDSHTIVHAEGSWAMTEGFGFSMSYTVNFESATVDYDAGRGAEALRLVEKGYPARVVKCEGLDGYAAEINYFLECIRGNRAPAVVTAEDAISAIEICEAEEKSVHTGQPVFLPVR